MAQIAFYKGKGKIGNALIRWWTDSPYSHCELVVGGICYSSSIMDKGVRSKVVNLSADNWDIVELPWATDADVLDYYSQTRMRPYGWIDLILRQVLRLPSVDESGEFCSEWCANALGIPDARDYSPAGLERIVRKMNAACTR